MGWSFKVEAALLLSALDMVRLAVSPSHETGCMVLLASGVVEACRNEFRITVAVPQLTVDAPLLLNHARLVAALRECDGAVVVAQSSPAASTVTVSGSGGRWKLNAVDASAWPRIPPRKQRLSPVCRLPADQLARCLAGTIDAASDAAGESRPALEGLRIEVLDGTVSFVATDGRRLYVAEAEVDQAVDDSGISLPASAARVMLTLAAAADGAAVQIVRSANHAGWTVGPVTVVASLLSGPYVPWRRAIPDREHLPLSIGASALLAAVRRAEVVTSRDSRAVAFRFEPERVVLAARSREYGSAEVACPAVGAKLEAILRLDPRHVRQWLTSLDAEAVVDVDAVDSESAVVLRHEDSLAVVLPLTADALMESAE